MSDGFAFKAHRIGRVLAIGDLSVDDVVLVDRPVAAGGKVIGQFVGTFDGGMSANLAFAAARAGAMAQLCTVVGRDDVGRRALDRLADAGVDVKLCQVAPEGETWRTVIQLDSEGEKALIGLYSGVKLPDVEQVPDSAFANAAIVAPLADDFHWASAVAQRASLFGALVAFDIEPEAARSLSAAGASELLNNVDIVSLNRASLAALGITTLGGAVDLLEGRTRLVVVLDGANGAWGFTSTAKRFVPAFGQPVDTTGAGDAFVGALLGVLANGRDLDEAMELGAATAAAAVGLRGARGYSVPAAPATASVKHVSPNDNRLLEQIFTSDDFGRRDRQSR